MLFSTFAVAFVATNYSAFIASCAGRRASSEAVGDAGYADNTPAAAINRGVDPEYLEEGSRLIKSWKAATPEDTDILKDAIEKGWLEGLSTKAVMKEYTRYQRFTTKCLGDKISNLKRNYRDVEERRRDSKFPSSSTFLLTTDINSQYCLFSGDSSRWWPRTPC